MIGQMTSSVIFRFLENVYLAETPLEKHHPLISHDRTQQTRIKSNRNRKNVHKLSYR